MSQNHPWESEWTVKDPDFGGGGQSKTLLVSRIAEPHTEGVLKILKQQTSTKARLRMHRDATNLQTLANQGVKVPHVLAGNTNEYENQDSELYFIMERVPGHTLQEEIQERRHLSIEKA